MIEYQNFMGSHHFIWFFGNVEDVNDPQQVGRVRVRIHGLHTDDTSQLPTTSLPWAFVGQSTNSTANKGIGRSPVGIDIGTQVFGFFLDGEHTQQPFVLCTLAGKPDGISDVPKLAVGTNTVKNTTVGSEPASKYAAKYPYNDATVTKSGHVIEIDDTPGSERIHLRHKDGSYVIMNPGGDLVIKAAKDSYDITAGNKTIYVKGNANVEVDGNASVTVKGNATLNVTGTTTIKTAALEVDAGSITLNEGI